MKFIYSVQSELLKLKRSAVLWVSIIGSLFLPIVFTIRYLSINMHLNKLENIGDINSWMPLFMQIARPFTGFLLPIGFILIGSLITQVEYKNNNWKQVHTTPQSFTRIFFAKYTVLLLIAILIFTVLKIGVLLLGFIPCLVLEGQLPNDMVPFSFLITESGKALLTCLPILSFQYLLGLQFKKFLIPMGVGFTVFIGTMMALRTKYVYFSPYSFAIYYLEGDLIPKHINIYIISALYFIGFTTLNYLLYVTKKQKG
jgi:lantibiotic transport system permease protein